MGNIFTALLLFLGIVALSGCKPIINLLAFHPDTKNMPSKDQLDPSVSERFILTSDDVRLQSYFLANSASQYLLIYFHGNAGNLSHRLWDLHQINQAGINVLGVSYRGYGASQGRPSEKGLYIDGESALQFATKQLGFPKARIILFGRSIGTTVAINTAQNKEIAGLILTTPLTNAQEYAKASGLGLVSFLATNTFNNIEKVKTVKCSTLIIHGTKDEVIPFRMGKAIFDNLKTKKQFVKIEGGTHNNLSTTFAKPYFNPISTFIQNTQQPTN